MEIIKKGFFYSPTDITGKPNIQIEDWSKDYPGVFAPCSTLALYPIAHANYSSPFGPEKHCRFRFEFNFETEREAQKIFDLLTTTNFKIEDLPQVLPKSASTPYPDYFDYL